MAASRTPNALSAVQIWTKMCMYTLLQCDPFAGNATIAVKAGVYFFTHNLMLPQRLTALW